MPIGMIANALRRGLWLALSLALAMICWTAPAPAQERLPWEPPAAAPGYPPYDGRSYDRTRPYATEPGARPERDARPEPYARPEPDRRYGDVYDPAPANGPLIRQPSTDPRNRDDRRYDDRRYGAATKPYDPYYAQPRPPAYDGTRQPYSGPPPRDYQAPGYYERNIPNRDPGYEDPGDRSPRTGGTYSMREIADAGHTFFGSISQGVASVIEYAFKKSGRPNGYILGEGAGGAFIAGLRYGEGTLYTKSAGTHRVYWQGPSIGYDAGAEGSKTMVLVYNLRDPSEIYNRFGGIDGSAYLVGGVGITFQKNKHVVLAPIRAGIGLRLGANIGYLKYTRRPTWNPF